MNKNLYLVVFLSLFMSNFLIGQTITLSGKVLRHNGDPLAGVTVKCTSTDPVISAADGSFSFTDLPEGESYLITGEFETDYFQNLSILDIIALSDHILEIEPFDYSYHQRLAGDVFSDGNLSTLDMVYINKIILRDEGTIPDVYWRFFDKELSPTPFFSEGIDLENIFVDSTNLELIGVKTGDVAIDHDYLPPPDAPNPFYYIDDLSVNQNEEFTVSIRANDFRDIAGYQHGLDWDINQLAFLGFENPTDFDLNINENPETDGHLLITAYEFPYFVSLDDGGILYNIQFKALQDLNTISESINFSTTINPLQTVYRRNDNDYDIFLIEGAYEGVVTSIERINSVESFEISPNPAKHEILVHVIFDQIEKGEISLFDTHGKLINSWSFSNDVLQKKLDIQKLAKGIYNLSIETENGSVSKRFIKQ